MKRKVTRAELHDMVWSDPISKIAPKFEISDVALSKICKKHGIPKPPRGYWAKHQAGKATNRTALPDRQLGMPEDIELRTGYLRETRSEDPAAIVIPPEPIFEETLDQLFTRVQRLVGRVTVSKSLERPHRSVAKLLELDEERREKQKSSDYSSIFDNVLFGTPYERRRLRLVNVIFMALSQAGALGTARGKDPAEFGVQIGEQHFSFMLDAAGISRSGWRNKEDLERKATDSMTLQISLWPETDELQLEWSDAPNDRLEKHVSEIVVALIVAGEYQYRRQMVARRQHLIEYKQFQIKEALREAEEQRQRDLAKKCEAERARIEKLLRDAENLDRAGQIRKYVQAAIQANQELADPVSVSEMSQWSDWALQQADRIDPILNRGFLESGDELKDLAD